MFDEPEYDDKDTECQRKIGDLMAEVSCFEIWLRSCSEQQFAQMQNYGSPPSELMGPLPDVNEEGCTIT